MDATTLLAALGTILAVISLAVHVLTYRRDRAIIVVKGQAIHGSGSGSRVEVTVRNEGRHGITLTDVGLVATAVTRRRTGLSTALQRLRGGDDSEIRRRGVTYGEYPTVIDDDDNYMDHTTFLEPGRSSTVSIPMETVARRQQDGWVSWPYAEDFTGRYHYAERPVHVQVVSKVS